MSFTAHCPVCGCVVDGRGIGVTRRRPAMGFALAWNPGPATVYRYHVGCWRLEYDRGPASLRAFRARTGTP